MNKSFAYNSYFYVEDSAIHGKGLFAKRPIKSGTYLGCYEGPVTTENDTHVLWAQMEDDRWVGRDGRNVLRYLNHSKKPSAEFEGFDLYAVKDILPNQEVTIDYGEEPCE